MLFKRLAGRFRPVVVAIEKIVEGNEQGAWQFANEDTEDQLPAMPTTVPPALAASAVPAAPRPPTNASSYASASASASASHQRQSSASGTR
ncbi:hypothetical protein CPB97_008510, partial [Podila verticillata]